MRAVTLMVCASILAACVSASALWPAPVLGVRIDAEQRVQTVVAGSAAEAAGVLEGDILLELKVVPGEGVNAAGTEAVSFTNTEKVRNLIEAEFWLEERTANGVMNYYPVSGPFILTLQRGDELVELKIRAEMLPPRDSRMSATPPPIDPSLTLL